MGDAIKFKIISIESEHHRLGLSIKALESEESRVKELPSEDTQTEPTEPATPTHQEDAAVS